MHEIENEIRPNDEPINLAMNSVVLGLLVASLSLDVAETLLGDVQAVNTKAIPAMTKLQERITKSVKHPEMADCLRTEDKSNKDAALFRSASRLLNELAARFGASPR